MEMFLGGLAAGLVLGIVATYFILVSSFGGSKGFALGKKVALKAGSDAEFAKKVEELFVPPPPPKPSGEAVRLLGILQREARLIDFLMENITPYSDEQVGAVRAGYSPEGTSRDQEACPVGAGFAPGRRSRRDGPDRVRSLSDSIGRKCDRPTSIQGYIGTRRLRTKSFDIPKPAEGQDEFVLMPAEVELS